MAHSTPPLRLAIVSTYPPRRCGIAAYTSDLRAALRSISPEPRVEIIAVDWDGLPYDEEVVAVVEPGNPASYLAAVDVLAERDTTAVLIQHEYGREYGVSGDADRHGTNLVTLARAATAYGLPHAVTLHTVPLRSTDAHRKLLGEMCAEAALVTVFTRTARDIVEELGIVPTNRLAVIPHGAPEALWTAPDPRPLRPELAELVDAGPVVATFGLIGAAKGLEVGIDAVAQLIDRHPGLRYVIAGQTHPEVIRRYGEAYRSQLVDQVSRLGLSEHVRFIDAFLGIDEIAALLRRTTVFLTPYRSPEQTSSGVLTFALACGRPVVSTAYQYAKELLTSGAGRLVPCDDPAALAAALDRLLSDRSAREHSSAVARQVGAELAWPTVARRMSTALNGTALAPQP
jgi:glycosyltransferase involved in cell wall biosynthesis